MIEEVAIAIRLSFQRHHLQLTQGLQRVAKKVFLALHGQVAQLGTRFEVEDEQQAVEIPQATACYFFLRFAIRCAVKGLMLQAQRVDRLIAENLHALAHGILQFLGYGKRMAVRVVIQRI